MPTAGLSREVPDTACASSTNAVDCERKRSEIPVGRISNTALHIQVEGKESKENQWFEGCFSKHRTEAYLEVVHIARRENLSVKIDYLSIVFEEIEAKDLIEKILDLPFGFFQIQPAKVKHQSYTKLYQFGTIKVFGDCEPCRSNPTGVRSYLVLSGSGCDDYYSFLQSKKDTYGDFFRKCSQYFRNERFHLTRLDIAIDDKNEVPYFTIEQIRNKCLKEEFISNSRSYRFSESSFIDGTAKTVYIGDGKSNQSYRFYDKDKEMSGKYQLPYEQIRSWKRTEIQLRDEVAHKFALLMSENPYELGQLAFDLIGSSLRFVSADQTQSNKSRWKTCRFWEQFLGDIKPLKIKPDRPGNMLQETQKWLKEGGALSAVKAFLFLKEHKALGDLKNVDLMIRQSKYSPALSNKLVAHLERRGREELIPLVYQDTKKEEFS